MAARKKARKRALDVLFEADQRRASVSEVLNARIECPGTEAALADYSIQIVTGVAESLKEIDAVISQASEGWALDRMPAVDRAILRIAVWEILSNPEVSTAVAIDQAVDLAGTLSTEASASFVNGVLGTIARTAPTDPAGSDGHPVE
ncbi:MAG: transcription antitermination factor NusB [Demequinaceae bacterium]|nr:transcription antitermination factor NusB [Demequinaceae bacterium]